MSDNRPAKLEDQIRDACRVRHYSLATERSYVRWFKQFVRWAGLKHPATLGADRIEAWLSHLATEREVSASTQRQALAANLQAALADVEDRERVRALLVELIGPVTIAREGDAVYAEMEAPAERLLVAASGQAPMGVVAGACNTTRRRVRIR